MRDDAATAAHADDAAAVGTPAATRRGPAPSAASAQAQLEACLAALGRFDVAELDAALRRTVVALSAEVFLDTLVVPFWDAVLERAGARWIVSEVGAAGMTEPQGDGCLVFAKARERRRQPVYPTGWRSLPNEALSALLPPA